MVVKEVEADDADTEWEMIDIVGLRTTTEHSGGCRCMKCMLDSATAEVLEEEANSTEAPDHVPAAIAKLTPDPAVRKFDFVSTRGTLMGVHRPPLEGYHHQRSARVGSQRALPLCLTCGCTFR